MTWHSRIAISLALIYIHLYVYSVVPTNHNVIRGQKFICGTYAPELVNATCKFKRFSRTKELWSYDAYFAPSNINNTDNLYLNVTVFKRQQNLEWRPHMIVHLIIDVCRYMNGTADSKFLDIIANELRKYSNSMNPCPYAGHIYLRNMTFNDEHWPPIVPAAEIYVDFQYFMYVGGSVKRLHYLRPYLDVKTKGIVYFK